MLNSSPGHSSPWAYNSNPYPATTMKKTIVFVTVLCVILSTVLSGDKVVPLPERLQTSYHLHQSCEITIDEKQVLCVSLFQIYGDKGLDFYVEDIKFKKVLDRTECFSVTMEPNADGTSDLTIFCFGRKKVGKDEKYELVDFVRINFDPKDTSFIYKKEDRLKEEAEKQKKKAPDRKPRPDGKTAIV